MEFYGTCDYSAVVKIGFSVRTRSLSCSMLMLFSLAGSSLPSEYGRAVRIGPTSLEVSEVVPPMITREGHVKHLVKSKGELLLVDRYPPKRRGRSGNKVEFRVYKLEIEHRRWVVVETLDDRILFLGQDSLFSLPARCFSSRHKGNCIVFADPVFMVFSLDDRKLSPIEQHTEYISIFYAPSL